VVNGLIYPRDPLNRRQRTHPLTQVVQTCSVTFLNEHPILSRNVQHSYSVSPFVSSVCSVVKKNRSTTEATEGHLNNEQPTTNYEREE
jgi:hypothetical protein